MNKLLVHGALALVLVTNSLHAALEFTLTPAVQSGALGTEVNFAGTLTNTSTTEKLFLNDIQFSFSGGAANALTPDSNVFFANVPGILLPGETYTGPVFTILLDSSAAPEDYSGSVTIQGGTDIFAANNLQVQNLQVSSPLVTIVATTPDAYEFGAVAAVFTISRSGSVNYDLLVSYAISGSAINGTRYNSLTSSVTVSAGAATAAINVIPIPNNLAEGDQTVILSISPFASYNIGAPASASATIHDKPMDAWRLQHFGADANVSEIAGDNADPEGDEITNLMEYGLFSDPNVSSVADLPSVAISGNHLQLTFRRNTSATDITYIAEARSDLASGSWAPIMTRAPGADWIANVDGATAVESGAGNFVSVTITDSVPILDPITSQQISKRFLRLRLER